MIDPIQFRPYDPRKDNQPIYAIDRSKGIEQNTQRILADMDAAENQRRKNDESRRANAQITARNLQNLGAFSETLAKIGTEVMDRYIDSEEQKAKYDDFTSQTQPSEEFIESEAVATASEQETNKGLTQYENAGGSPVISESVRTGSWWYRRKRDKLNLQRAAQEFPLWFTENEENITANVGGQEMRLGDAKSLAELAAFKNAVFQQYTSGFKGYDRNAMASYLYPEIEKAWGRYQTTWAKARSAQIKADRLYEAQDGLLSAVGTPNMGAAVWEYWQTRMSQGLTSSAARKELGEFLLTNEKLFTSDDIDAIEQYRVTWNDGTSKELGKVLGRELENLRYAAADNIARDLEISQKELEAKRKSYEMKFDQLTSELKEPLTNERINELKADWRADGLGEPPSFFDDYITSEEQDVNQAMAELQAKYDKQGFITVDDTNGMPLEVRNSKEVQDMIETGSALAGMTKQDQKDIENSVKGLTNKATNLKAEDRNNDVYFGAERRIRADLEKAFRREVQSGRFTKDDGSTDYAAALTQAEAKIREKIDQKAVDYTKPEAYDPRTGSAAQQERIKGLRRVMRQDPNFFTQTNISTEQELSQAQRQIMTGQGGYPPVYVDMARGLKNITPYDIAMGQLDVNGFKVNPPAIEEDLKKQAASVQELLKFHNTPNRTARAFTPDMSAPETITLGKTNLTPQETAFIATVRELEGTAGSDGYNTWFGGRTDLDLSAMTVSEVVAEQNRRLRTGQATYGRYKSAAVGAGQFMKPEETVREMGLDPSKVRYTPQLQDAMILFQALKRRGVDPKKVLTVRDMSILGGEWASFTPQYGQTKRTAAQSLAVYQRNLRRAQGGN